MTTDPPRSARLDHRRGLVSAIALLVLGGVLALAGASQPWLRLHQQRALGLPALDASIAGHTVEPAVTGSAVVALAGAVALLATSGYLRVAVGAALAVVGVILTWRSSVATSVSSGRARELLAARHPGAVLDPGAVPTVERVVGWPLIALGGGVLVIAAGLIVAGFGRRWTGLSARYEPPAPRGTDGDATDGDGAGPTPARTRAPEDEEQARQRADAALWRSVDRGDDPTL